ncbi:MAG: hypothetical protein KHW87_09555 [Clostridiales bacterium]|nr:hypothetical protein [Clostridiales bacterium]
MFEKNLHTTVLFDIYGDMLTSQQQAVIDMYYNQDLSLTEISEQIGITRQGVQYTLKHGEDALWHMEQVLGLAAQSIRTKQLANELETQIRSLPLPPQAEDKRSYLLELIQKLSAAESAENFHTNTEDESKTTTR